VGRQTSGVAVGFLRSICLAFGNRRNRASLKIMGNCSSRSALDVLVDHVHHGILISVVDPRGRSQLTLRQDGFQPTLTAPLILLTNPELERSSSNPFPSSRQIALCIHSERRACMTSMRAARAAGSHEATTAAVSSTNAESTTGKAPGIFTSGK
jgi:hypothetical protein